MQYYQFQISVPKRVCIAIGRDIGRTEFFEWLWQSFGERGLSGVHEGTLLSEAAAEQGMEADAWIVDSAEAPVSRDWVSQMEASVAELYFAEQLQAEQAHRELSALSTHLELGPVMASPNRDWNAEWAASYVQSKDGLTTPPFWRVFPVVDDTDYIKPVQTGELPIYIVPGAGFGTGTHETTQLCLQLMGESIEVGQSFRALDFGAGSGILSVGLARLGGQVDAVEVDPMAVENARNNRSLNGMDSQVSLSLELPPTGQYQVVVANILRPVLLAFAPLLVQRLMPGGLLILSGLIESDVEQVRDAYERLLPPGSVYRQLRSGDWFALLWQLGQF